MAVPQFSITPFELILSAVPVAVLFIVILVYIISAYWREDARTRVKEFSSNLRETQTNLKLAEQRLRKFAQVRGEIPFVDAYDHTNRTLEQCVVALKSQYQGYSEVQQEIADQMVNIPRNMIMAPYLWFETRRKQQRFQRELSHLKHLSQELESALRELENVGRTTATAARSAYQQLLELGNILQTLAQRQIHGETFTRVRQRYAFIYDELNHLPAHFLQPSAEPSETDFQNHAEVVKVAGMLDRHSAELSALLHSAQNWEAQHNLIHEQLHQLTERQHEIAARLGQIPVGVDSTPLLQTLNECRGLIRNVRERARRTEADELRYLLRETRQIERIFSSLIDEINQLVRMFDGYQQLRSQLDGEWQQLKTIAYRLSQNPFLPVQLDQTATALNAIHKEINDLPELNRPMTPDELRRSFHQTHTLLQNSQKYTPELEVLQNNHADLLVLLKRLKTAEIEQWADQMTAIHQTTVVFHPDNYHRIPALKDLDIAEEIQGIKVKAGLLPALNSSVRESQVTQLLGQAGELDAQRKLLDDACQSRLQQYRILKGIDQKLREKVADMEQAIERLDSLMLDDTSLQQKAARSVRVYDKKRESLLRLLDSPGEGMLENKARELDTLDQQIAKDVRIWFEDLSRRQHEEDDSLAQSLGFIRSMVVLNEPILTQAEEKLQQNKKGKLSMDYSEGLSLLEQVDQLAAMADTHHATQTLVGDMQLLGTEVKQVHETLETSLYRCVQKIEGTARWIDPSGWNQRALSFDRLRKEINAIQQETQQLAQNGESFDRFSHQANSMVQRLSEAEKRLDQIINEAEQERKLVEEAEKAVDDTIQLWRKLADNANSDRSLRYSVQEVLQQYQQQYTQERKKFERGNLPLEGYLRSLKQINRRLNAESVSSDDGKRVDITGRTFSR